MSMANKMRVLIIDDNEDVTEAVSDYLEYQLYHERYFSIT
jgi:DNA-binding response OmpR family regulator